MKSYKRLGAAVLLFIGILITSFTGIKGSSVQAANTHSIDIERGSSQYLSISDGSQTGLDITGNFTIESWIKLESLPSDGQNYFIASKWEDGDWANGSYEFRVRNAGGTHYLTLSTSNGSTGNNPEVSWSPSTGTWYHVAVVYTTSGTAKFYVNGTQQGSTQTGLVTSIQDSGTSFLVGANDPSSPTNFFDGLIDDLRVWNTARTETEISDDKDRELNGNETGLVGYWKLNNSLSDTTTNGNTLTNNNSAIFSTDTPFSFTELLKVRKSTSESLSSSTVLQNDDALNLSLDANKTYIIDGVIFASSTSATPDILIGFFGQTGSIITIGYTNDVNEMVLSSGAASSRINLPANTPTSIHIKGTVVTGSASGDFQLKWAQATSNGAPTTVMAGSYLRAEAI